MLEQAAIRTDLAISNEHISLIRRWLDEYLPAEIRAGTLAETTLRPYRHAASRWCAFLAIEARPSPLHVTTWVVSLRESGKAPSTVAGYLAAIKSCYRWLESEACYPNIARSVRSPRVLKDTPLPCPTSVAVEAMYRSISSMSLQGLRDRALIAVLYSTALRTISVCRARVEDVDLTTATLRHQPKGHAGKDAVAVLSATATEALRAYLGMREPLRGDAPLFTAAGNRRNDESGLTSRSIRAIVLGLAETQGLALRTADGRIRNRGHYSAHAIRRASITAVAERLGLDAARTLAGHASVDTTRRAYARVNSYRQLQLAATTLDFLGGPE